MVVVHCLVPNCKIWWSIWLGVKPPAWPIGAAASLEKALISRCEWILHGWESIVSVDAPQVLLWNLLSDCRSNTCVSSFNCRFNKLQSNNICGNSMEDYIRINYITYDLGTQYVHHELRHFLQILQIIVAWMRVFLLISGWPDLNWQLELDIGYGSMQLSEWYMYFAAFFVSKCRVRQQKAWCNFHLASIWMVIWAICEACMPQRCTESIGHVVFFCVIEYVGEKSELWMLVHACTEQLIYVL